MSKPIEYLRNRPNILRLNSQELLKNIDYQLRDLCKTIGVKLIFIDSPPSTNIDSCCCFYYRNIRDILLIKSNIIPLQNELQCTFSQASNIAFLHELGHCLLFAIGAEQTEEAAWIEGSRFLEVSGVPPYLYEKAMMKYVSI
jgi:hypothetical protein